MTDKSFDVAIIGAGPGGYVAAIRAAQLGLDTAIIEHQELGGVCLNWGCIPTKALLRSAEVVRMVREAGKFGVETELSEIDLSAMVERSRQIASKLNQGVAHLLKKNGVSVYRASAKLLGKQQILLHKKDDGVYEKISARHIIIATGARERVLPGFEMNRQNLWYYRQALTPEKLPKRLLVIGSGAIGVEFASFYHAIGSEVHIVEMADHLLPQEDQDISAYMENSLQKQGVCVHVGTSVCSKSHNGNSWQVTLQNESEPIEVDVILVATGIVGNVENLGLEHTNVKLAKSHIITDTFSQTDEAGIFAIGDVAQGPWLAHKASHEAVACVEHIAGLDPEQVCMAHVPACTYSHPQVAHVGMSQFQAEQSGYKVRIGKFPFTANGKALAMGQSEGFVKVIFDASSGELLGAHMVGDEVTEMIQGYTVAMRLETTEAELMQTVFPHPSQSEAMHEAVLDAYKKVLHM